MQGSTTEDVSSFVKMLDNNQNFKFPRSEPKPGEVYGNDLQPKPQRARGDARKKLKPRNSFLNNNTFNKLQFLTNKFLN